MNASALILRGGWDGHDPVAVSELFARILDGEGIRAEIHESLEPLADRGWLMDFDLIVPIWTMGRIEREQCRNVMEAVASGVGLAGCHGGMCDAFRDETDWHFLTGGQWVAHPGGDGVEHRIEIANSSSPVVDGLGDFTVRTEHYYLHVDPANEVLATTRFPLVDGPHAANGPVDMPVAWTRRWGSGRVFYCALGHRASVFDVPEARELVRRGLVWAARRRNGPGEAGR